MLLFGLPQTKSPRKIHGKHECPSYFKKMTILALGYTIMFWCARISSLVNNTRLVKKEEERGGAL